jgi:GMP synthase (glutamine-hydrolysing)
MKNPYENLRLGDAFDIGAYESTVIEAIRHQVGSGQVLLALSGGVDSAVCAALLAKAVPGKLHCIFVDNGLMRKNEGDEVEEAFRGRELNFIRVNEEDRFLSRLAGVTDPEMKRKIIGEEFIRVFEEESGKLHGIEYLAQGTIYTDVLESGSKDSAAIKSHHNVAGLPDKIGFKGIVEPLRGLYKGEVRELGWQLGLPTTLTERQPFPGPGLAVRCIGEVTKEKLDVLRDADAIFREEVIASDSHADQYFAVLTDTRTVGISRNTRAYGYTVALRTIKTNDYMTAEYVPLPHNLLSQIVERITSEVPAITRVVYDITNKPPATVEWE